MNTGILQGLNLTSGHTQNLVGVGKLFFLTPEWLQRPRITGKWGTYRFVLFYFVSWWQASSDCDQSALLSMLVSDQNSEFTPTCCYTLLKKFSIPLTQDDHIPRQNYYCLPSVLYGVCFN